MRSLSPQQPRSRRDSVAVTVVGLVLAIGCQSTPKPAAEACVGTPYLHVQNSLGYAVEVYSTANTPQLVGTAGAGPTELTIPPNVAPNSGFRARDLDGKWIVPAFGGQRDASRITFQVRCR